jgi:hypothetical protein
MPLNAYLDALDNVTTTGRFFVDLARRLGPGTVVAGEDATRLAHAFGLPVPPDLAGATIETMEEGHKGKHAEHAAARAPGGPIQIVVTYPPVVPPEPVPLKFKKCFQVCKTVGGAKVCAEVCVDIDVGLGGVHGSITATVSVTF